MGSSRVGSDGVEGNPCTRGKISGKDVFYTWVGLQFSVDKAENVVKFLQPRKENVMFFYVSQEWVWIVGQQTENRISVFGGDQQGIYEYNADLVDVSGHPHATTMTYPKEQAVWEGLFGVVRMTIGKAAVFKVVFRLDEIIRPDQSLC